MVCTHPWMYSMLHQKGYWSWQICMKITMVISCFYSTPQFYKAQNGSIYSICTQVFVHYWVDTKPLKRHPNRPHQYDIRKKTVLCLYIIYTQEYLRKIRRRHIYRILSLEMVASHSRLIYGTSRGWTLAVPKEIQPGPNFIKPVSTQTCLAQKNLA